MSLPIIIVGFFYLSVLYKLLLIIFTILTSSNLQNLILDIRHATQGRVGGGLPCRFSKIEEIALILEKKAMIVFIFWLNFPLKI